MAETKARAPIFRGVRNENTVAASAGKARKARERRFREALAIVRLAGCQVIVPEIVTLDLIPSRRDVKVTE